MADIISPDLDTSIIHHIHPLMITASMIFAVIAAFACLSVLIPGIISRILPEAVQIPFWQFLPFDRIAKDGKTICCERGGMSGKMYIRVLKLEGADISLASESLRKSLFEERKTMLYELERTEITGMQFFTIKTPTSVSWNIFSTQPILRIIQQLSAKNIQRSTQLEHYIAISSARSNIEKAMKALNEAETMIIEKMYSYNVHVLNERDTRSIYSEENRKYFDLNRHIKNPGPLILYGRIISPVTRPRPRGMDYTGPLSALVNTDIISFAKTGAAGIITFSNGNDLIWSSIVTYREIGERTTEEVSAMLLALPYELLIYHAVEPMTTIEAITRMKQHAAGAVIQNFSNSAVPDINNVIKKLEGTSTDIERSRMLYYSMHVMPMCKTRDELEDAISAIKNALGQTGGSGIPLRYTAQTTWISMWDAKHSGWPRRFRFLTENVATMIYPQKTIKAHIGSAWCSTEPVAWFKTTTGDPFPFNFHITNERGAIGHTMIIGASGSGKTVLATYLCSMTARFPNMRLFLFDRLLGMKVFTQSAGGTYIDFANAIDTGIFNPLLMRNTKDNNLFLLRFLQMLSDLDDPDSIEQINILIRNIFNSESLSRDLRRLSKAAPAAFQPTSQILRNLRPWIDPTSPRGNIFNAPEELFTSSLASSRIVGYEMTPILDDQQLAAPTLSYLLHSIHNIARETSCPSLVFVDEARAMYSNDKFASVMAQPLLLESRKLNQIVIFAFQMAEHVTSLSPVAKANLLSQCKTQILFPISASAKEDASITAYEEFGLTQSEKDYLTGKTRLPNGNRFTALVRREGCESAILSVDLRYLEKYLQIYSSDRQDVKMFNEKTENNPDFNAGVMQYINDSYLRKKSAEV